MDTQDLTTEDGIINYLRSCSSPEGKNVTKAERLPEGFAGFVYRVHVQDSKSPTVIVKHAEGYAARSSQWKLDTNRMMYECKAMTYLSRPEMQTDKMVRTPKLLFYDNDRHVLIMEDAGNLPSLKGWLQSGVDLETTRNIGMVLGRFLAKVHNSTAGNQEILSMFNGNTTAKWLSGTLYFGGLSAAAEKFGYTDDHFHEVAKEGQREVEESTDVLTLGDFWTGNILVNTDGPGDLRLFVLDLELAKPGTAAFDIGQMAAEMYCLSAFRDPNLGSDLLHTFLTSYRESRQGNVDAAKVAIRIGAHLFVTMPRAWSNEATQDRIMEVVKTGADLICSGYQKDEVALKESIVGPLMAEVELQAFN